MNENAERWLSFAREDLLAAQSNVVPPKTHSIQELMCRLPQMAWNRGADKFAELDDYYIPTRYPDALPGSLPDGLPTERDANRAIALAVELLSNVERHLAA